MCSICSFHNAEFRELLDEQELTHRESLFSSVHRESMLAFVNLVLIDPPYNVRRSRHDDNSEYDLLKSEDIAEVVELCARKMRPKGHDHLFCSALQFNQWHRVLSRAIKDDGTESEEIEGGPTKEGEQKKKAVFDVEVIP